MDEHCVAELVRVRDLSEKMKTGDRSRIAGRIALLHDVMTRGLKIPHEKKPSGPSRVAQRTISETTARV